MGETLVRCRTNTPGSTLELMVLASGRRSCIAVDLDSGAFVRAIEPSSRPLLAPFTVVRGRTIEPEYDRPEQPELASFERPLTPIGLINARRAERFIRPLIHPKNRPLLGFFGPSTPWWEHETTGPSVAVVDIDKTLRANLTANGLRARFLWNAGVHDLPLEDLRLLGRLDWVPQHANVGLPLTEMLGFRPNRIVVAISRPLNGYCSKVIAGLLP
jgi:hypothetical protein